MRHDGEKFIKMAHFLPRMSLHWHIIINQSIEVTLEFTPDVVHSLGLEIRIMTKCIILNIIQNIFTTLKIPCVLSIHFSPIPIPLPANTHLFIVSSFALPRMPYIFWITQYAVFSYWFISLNNTYLRLCHVFS